MVVQVNSTEDEVLEGKMEASTNQLDEEPPSSSNQIQGETPFTSSEWLRTSTKLKNIYKATTDENHTTEGQEIMLGTLDAQPISSISPILENDDAETYSMKEVMKIVNQLPQSVGSHINPSNTETTNLRTELREVSQQ